MAPAGVAKQIEQVAYLPRFFLGAGIPGKLFFKPEAVDDDGLVVAKLANPFGAVTLAEAAVFSSTHRRVGNDEID